MSKIKEFIISTAIKYFSKSDEVLKTNEDDETLTAFINDAQCLILCIIFNKNGIEYHKEVSYEMNAVIIFYKNKPTTLENDDSLVYLGLSVLPNNPAESFYLSLRHIYGPLLQADNSLFLDPKLQEMLLNLEASLRTLAHGNDGGPSLMVVITVDDELQYWQTIADESKTKKQRDMAESFVSILQTLSQEIRSIDNNEVTEIKDAMENASGLLDDLWRHSNYLYPQKRMTHLLDVIGNTCISKLQENLMLADIWGNDSNILNTITGCVDTVSSWLNACTNLTSKYWPNHSLHVWEGPPHESRYVKIFNERLKDVADIRSTHLQLTKLLSKAEQDELNTTKMFLPFKGINTWQCTPKNNTIWQKSKSQFEKMLIPAEERISEKLKSRLNGFSANQILYEFNKYASLIERPSVFRTLLKERQMLMGTLGKLLKEIESQIGTEKIPLGNEFIVPEVSPLVQQIQWTKRMEAKVVQIEKTIKNILSDLEGNTDMLFHANSVSKSLHNLQTLLFEDWTRTLQVELNNKTLVLSSDTPVVEFSGENNLMRVTFNPRIVSLERDIRHMSILGFTVPTGIKEAINHAAKFMEHARALQQVASFHNTQGERMIASQRPMMLNAAIQLSSLVKEQTAVPWKDINAVSNYVEKLKNSVDNLVKQNTFLTGQHIIMRNIVLSLMDTNLLQKQNEWKKSVRQMMELIEKVESQGYTNTKAWMMHWNIQLYKALEHQYRTILIDPLSHLPIIRVELIFRQQGIHLQPPLEEIRATCHAHLKKLINLPFHFYGLQKQQIENESIFSTIVSRNSWLAAGAMQEIENTLEKVVEVVQRWKKWGALGSVDLENLCELHLSHPSDWDKNFKECKALGQTIAKLPMEDEQIDWIWISSASLRNDLESHNRRYWITLTTSLQTSLQRDIVTLEAYFLSAHATIGQNVPKTAKELATLNEEFFKLKDKLPQMATLFDELRRKQTMVRAWGGERIQQMDNLTKKWDNLSTLIQNHEKLISHQAESVKTSLLSDWSNLFASLDVWHSRWIQNKPKTEHFTNTTLSELKIKHKLWTDACEIWDDYKSNKENIIIECKKFNLDLEDPPSWKKIENNMEADKQYWETFQMFLDELTSLGSQEWIIFQKKIHLLDDFILDWSKKLEPFTPITLFIQKEIDKYKEIIPSLKYLRSSDFTEKHWREIYSLLDIPTKSPDTLILSDLLNVSQSIKDTSKELQKIWVDASHEAIVREAVAELELWLAGARLVIVKHADNKGQQVPIIKDFKDILIKVEEYQNLAGSARTASNLTDGSNSNDQLSLWETRLSLMKTILTSLAHIQRKWVYLEPILSGEAINSKEGMGNGTFHRLDKDFRHVMKVVETDPRLSALIRFPGLSSLLTTLTSQLVQCQNTLEQYMAEKRSIFSRFFFLNDDDLLEMLGQARITSQNRESVLQSHIKKLFPGSVGVHLGPGAVCITALQGQYGERLVLDTPVDIDAPIEIWLRQLEEQMHHSLHTCIKQCLLQTEVQKNTLLNYPTQVLCLVQSIRFTENVEKAIGSHQLHGMRDTVNKELQKYLKTDIQECDNNLDKHKLQALILQDYHELEILNELIDNSVSTIDQWHWQKQLRFYIENNSIHGCIGLAKLPYTYEYLGINTGNLVRTKLTDQCFLILSQALHLGMAGNPFGPAGTGKTESVKALGGLLGRLVLVFNCDEGMDKVTMGRLLSGLALSGSWGCFDEFNRLEEKTLSEIAQQLSSILEAIGNKNDSNMSILNGKEVKVSVGCGVFVTMNPAGGSYGGRRNLPEGINRLLRPCAMWQPRAAHIGSALLASHGYTNSQQLAEKLVTCFDMAKSLLTNKHHYDWGLRALKTIIGSCGSIIRETYLTSKSYPDIDQQASLIVQALKLNTMSKLSYEDHGRFTSIIEIIFSGITTSITTANELQDTLKECCIAKNLTPNENQIQKCIELNDQLRQRMGVVLVGPPGSGKTTIYQLLKNALIKIGNNIGQHIICPKAMNRTDLLGYIDSDTRQWCDGVISTIGLDVVNQQADLWSWIICDGDVDPEWIESLNSVLDDNRLLTLPSGWRIQFGNNVNFIFETHDLSNASPATITRMGIILLSDEECCYNEVIQSWLKDYSTNDDWSYTTANLIKDVLKNAVEWAQANSSDFLIPYHKVPLIRQILTFLDLDNKNKNIDELLAIALLKGLTSITKPRAFDSILEQISQWTGASTHVLLWSNASDMESNYGSISIDSSLFNTSKRISGFLSTTQTWIDTNQHFMIFGPPASGKSMILDYLLRGLRNSVVITLQCTPILDIKHVIQALKQKSALRSEGGKSGSGPIILIVKSLHRANSDKWNTSILQSFLLQLIHHGGFWQKSEGTGSDRMHWFKLKPFVLITTATIEDSGLRICKRLSNSMKIVNLTNPDERELSEICQTNLYKVLEKLSIGNEDIKKLNEFSLKMLALYNDVIENFSNEVHYKWTTQDLTKWCQNLSFYAINDFNTGCKAIGEESLCLFRDRLISMDDKKLFDVLIKKHLNINSSQDQSFVPKNGNKGFYMELMDTNDWILNINKIINQCNSEMENGCSAFGECGAEQCPELRRLVTLAGRVMNGNSNAVVFVGAAGMGRRAAARIAAENMSVKYVTFSTPQQFSLQIKNILASCGCDCLSTMIVLEEAAASDHTVLGTIEALLGKGNNQISLPLYSQEIETLISQMKSPNNEPKTLDVFLANIQKYLGIVLLLDVKQHNLKELFSSYSLLYQRCQLMWLDKWSEDTIKDLPKIIVDKKISSDPNLENCLVKISPGKFLDIFSTITQDELHTSYRYILFLKTFLNIYSEKKTYLEERKAKLQSGVLALTNAQDEVDRLKKDAAEQQIILAEKQMLATQALNQIGATMQSATAHKQEMEVLKQNAEIENVRLQERKGEIERELSEVEPIIQEARAAVGDIKPESLSEVRSLRAPPEPVRDVLEGVLRLMGIADTSWHSMKMFLSKRGIKDDIRTFDASNISQESLLAVGKLIASHGASFSEKTAKRASVACAPLAAWVLANVKYANVLHKIAPLEAEQRGLSRNLANAELQISNLSSNLNTVDERVSGLKEQLNTYTKQATEVEIHLNSVQNTISKAEQLVHKLSNEFTRWHENLNSLSKDCDDISINAILAAGYLIFLTNDNEEIRLSKIEKWCQYFEDTMSFSIKEFFISHDEEIKWIDYGLPSNKSAIHNAIIINEALKEQKNGLVPLVIDPNDGAINWILQNLKNSPKDVVTQHDVKFNTIMQHAIRFGRILIIKDLSAIDDSWGPLLRGQIPSIAAGVNSINPAFRLILFSRDASLLSHISSFYKVLVSVVDFTPQKQGLIDQLVFYAVNQEEPELQTKKLEINAKQNKLQIEQEQLEVQLLSQLSSGDILHNATLLESLEYTQQAGVEINASLKEAADVVSTINKQCELYKPLASRVASACLAISSLSYHYPLMSLSLSTVTKIFLKMLEKFRRSNSDNESIGRNVIVALLERVLVALNKENHCSVLLYLIHLIYPDHITQQEWGVLISNPEKYVTEKSEMGNSVEFKWINEDRGPNLRVLQTFLPELYSNLQLENESLWRKFVTSGDWDSIPTHVKLTPFQKVLLTWAFNPVKLNTSFNKAISQILGVNQLFPSGDLISTVEKWGSPEQPILVIGASGTDPIDQIKTRAANVVGINNYKQLWLSENAATDAFERLNDSIQWVMKSGGWLVVVVAAGDFMEKEFHQLLVQTKTLLDLADSNARIWIVAENANIPSLLTSNCVNVIMEAPTGIKNNLLRILSIWGPQQDSQLNEKIKIDNKTIRLEFSLALAHSVIQERCTYIPHGWRYNYGFSWGDIEASLIAVRMMGRTEAGGLCTVLYSGRIYWEQDIRLISALLDRHFDESVIGHAWKPLGMDMSLPMTTKIQDYLRVLSSIPSNDNPVLLSLPQNIQTAQEQQKGNNVILQLKSLTYGQVALEFNKKMLKKKLTPYLTLWKKLNSGNDSLIKAKIPDFKNDSWTGLKALDLCEWEVAKMGIKNIHTDLSELHSLISINDSDHRQLALNLIADKTPPSWLKYWNGGPHSATSFITGFCERATAAHKRISKDSGSSNRSILALSSFLKPDCVYNALLWEAAKLLALPPERLKAVYKWNDNDQDSSGKVILTDLWLEGAVWEMGRLQPCRVDTPSQTKAPPISLKFVANDSLVEYVDKNQVEIPIFTSAERNGMIFKIGAPSGDQFNKNLWLLNSTALIIS